DYYDYGNEPFYGPVEQINPGGGGNKSVNAQIDYTTPFANLNSKMDLGLKNQWTTFESFNNPIKHVPNSTDGVLDTTLQNNYRFNQNVFAAYANYGGKIDRLGYQAGLRMEYATYSGALTMSPFTEFSNTFLSLFPSAYL